MEPTLKLLRPAEVCQLLGISRSTLWRLTRAGAVAQPLRLSANVVAYREDSIRAFLQGREHTEPQPTAAE